MTEKARGTSESELAEFYDRTHSMSEFDESAAYPVEVRRKVTISVRFSEEEIEALRKEAERAGVTVTARTSARLRSRPDRDHSCPVP